MTDRLKEITDRLRLERQEEERAAKRTGRSAKPAPSKPAPVQVTEAFNAVWNKDPEAAARSRRAIALLNERGPLLAEKIRLTVGGFRAQVEITMIKGKGEALQEWARLGIEAARERDPGRSAQLKMEAEASRLEARAAEEQLTVTSAPDPDLAPVLARLEAIDAELSAMGVLAKTVPRAPAPTEPEPK